MDTPFGFTAIAADDPATVRGELMDKKVRGAAKPIGAMFNGEMDYDAARVMESLQVWAAAGEKFGDMFPDGSEGGRAAPAIWSDRAGFDSAMQDWRDATAAAIDAAPATLDEAKPTVGPIFGTCKNCHDTYRLEEE